MFASDSDFKTTGTAWLLNESRCSGAQRLEAPQQLKYPVQWPSPVPRSWRSLPRAMSTDSETWRSIVRSRPFDRVNPPTSMLIVFQQHEGFGEPGLRQVPSPRFSESILAVKRGLDRSLGCAGLRSRPGRRTRHHEAGPKSLNSEIQLGMPSHSSKMALQQVLAMEIKI